VLGLGAELSNSIGELAVRAGCVHADWAPRMAEACRALLITVIVPEGVDRQGTLSCMLYSALMLDLSRHLSQTLYGLRDELSHTARRAVGGDQRPTPPESEYRQEKAATSHNKVCLTFDDWTFDVLVRLAESQEWEGTDSEFVSSLLAQVLEFDDTEGLFADYVGIVNGIRSGVASAVQEASKALSLRLQEVA